MICGGSRGPAMELKVIKTEGEYEAALAEIERLIDIDSDEGSDEASHLELLALLVHDYEAKRFPIEIPDPIEALRFRMEQLGLTQRDLVAFIGSRSKVSEVLSRKRTLTLAMMRALHKGLGIPAEVLLQEAGASLPDDEGIKWERYPLREMINRGWVKATMSDAHERGEELIGEFFAPLRNYEPGWALYRRTVRIRAARSMDQYALDVWRARVMMRAFEEKTAGEYQRGTVDITFMRELVRLSWFDEAPLLAKEFLSKHGIFLIIEPHLPRTHLDGAAFLLPSGNPVIGLTLRYDRIDYFWFCLIHELAHVARHLEISSEPIFDDLEASGDVDPIEKEADQLAGEALIPEDVWIRSPASRIRSPSAVKHLAQKLRIHPAIVAGRIRFEAKNFGILNQLVGHRQVRRYFPEINWAE